MSYLADYSRSERAEEAAKDGLMTASALGRRLGVSAKAVKEVLGDGQEWHHTSARYNATDYYSIDQLTGDGLRDAIDRVKRMRAYDDERKRAAVLERIGTADVAYSERRRGGWIKNWSKRVSGKFTLKGDWWTLPDGSRKRHDKVAFVEETK